eukprot:14410039-Ditylum_brightwellii.AAC.1
MVQQRAKIHEVSDISIPENVPKKKLDKYMLRALKTMVKASFTLAKLSLRVPHHSSLSTESNNLELMMSKNAHLANKLLQLHTQTLSASESGGSTTTKVSPLVELKWACYHGNSKDQMLWACIEKLQDLYHQGKVINSWKVLVDIAHKILLSEVITHNWKAQCIVTVAKIKAFFSMTPAKMHQLLGMATADDDAVEEFDVLHVFKQISLIHKEQEDTADDFAVDDEDAMLVNGEDGQMIDIIL